MTPTPIRAEAREAIMEWKPEVHSKLLQRARQLAGLTRKQLAEKIAASAQSVFNWETGFSSPQGKYRDALFKELSEDAFDPEKAAPEIEPTAFGRWVEDNRSKAGWSRQELASKVSVSAMTIYNIETGRVTNPQQATVEKLETAFKQQVPPETSQEIEESSTVGVEGVGQFLDFDPHDRVNLPALPGVYVFYDVSERPVYVGEAGNIAKRISDPHTGHIDKFWYRSPIVHTANFVQIENEKLRRQIETTMIKFMKSNAVINKKGVERGA